MHWFRTKQFLLLKAVVVGLVPLVLFLTPINTLEVTPDICPIHRFTGHDCPGCGTTHAVLSAMHLRFADDWLFNKNIVIVFPLLIYFWCKLMYSYYTTWKSFRTKE